MMLICSFILLLAFILGIPEYFSEVPNDGSLRVLLNYVRLHLKKNGKERTCISI